MTAGRRELVRRAIGPFRRGSRLKKEWRKSQCACCHHEAESEAHDNLGTDSETLRHSHGECTEARNGHLYPSEQKRRNIATKEAESTESEDDEGEHEAGDTGTFDVDFDFFPPSEDDFHGIKALLSSYLPGSLPAAFGKPSSTPHEANGNPRARNKSWSTEPTVTGASEIVAGTSKPFGFSVFSDRSGLADSVCGQAHVGSVVKTGKEEAALGFITCLPLKDHEGKGWPEQILGHVAHCSALAANSVGGGGGGGGGGFGQKLAGKSLSLLLCERVANFPPQLVPPLYDSLAGEVEHQEQQQQGKGKKEEVKDLHLLLVSRVFLPTQPPSPSASTSARQNMASKRSKKEEQEEGREPWYPKFEDEILHKRSIWSAAWRVEETSLGARELRGHQEHQLAVLLKASVLKACAKEIAAMVDGGS